MLNVLIYLLISDNNIIHIVSKNTVLQHISLSNVQLFESHILPLYVSELLYDDAEVIMRIISIIALIFYRVL